MASSGGPGGPGKKPPNPSSTIVGLTSGPHGAPPTFGGSPTFSPPSEPAPHGHGHPDQANQVGGELPRAHVHAFGGEAVDVPPGASFDSIEAPGSKFVAFLKISSRRAFRLRIEPAEVLPSERRSLESASPPITDRNLQAFLA